ncbi:MAG: hypothetical protein IJT89_09485 [Bacteroidaceae bacterium]|nr:hypothetical protein [Bacteroidaceae bacterium]MBQ4460453.1 hypothetical protein [Bacteroidaceae bacterium]MBQ7484269.1 hypothetical protein [Bacteroidaceae bacterium]
MKQMYVKPEMAVKEVIERCSILESSDDNWTISPSVKNEDKHGNPQAFYNA